MDGDQTHCQKEKKRKPLQAQVHREKPANLRQGTLTRQKSRSVQHHKVLHHQ
jgi:hypothetical protein